MNDRLIAMQSVLADVELLGWRFLRDMMQEAMPEYWERRGQAFAAVGSESADETAMACRAKAYVLRNYGPGREEMADFGSQYLAELRKHRAEGRAA